ncbi:PAS domain-containing sensor histidine kinase, partial [candidate division TA06 bacterium]
MDGLARTEIGIDIVGIDYRVVFQNQTLKQRFGDLSGQLCYEKYMGLERPCDFCPMMKAIRRNRVESIELIAADGRNYELLSAPFPNPDGTVDKAIEVVLDITERKQAEEREKRLQEELYLSSRLASIGELAAGVAHELNNPLTGIIGFSQRLLRKSTDETVSQDLERIH